MTVTTEFLDELRGELDKEHGFEPGWSGPITDTYLRGYGKHPNAKKHAEVDSYREGLNHGWY